MWAFYLLFEANSRIRGPHSPKRLAPVILLFFVRNRNPRRCGVEEAEAMNENLTRTLKKLARAWQDILASATVIDLGIETRGKRIAKVAAQARSTYAVLSKSK
jgi:hypothetical protein